MRIRGKIGYGSWPKDKPDKDLKKLQHLIILFFQCIMINFSTSLNTQILEDDRSRRLD